MTLRLRRHQIEFRYIFVAFAAGSREIKTENKDPHPTIRETANIAPSSRNPVGWVGGICGRMHWGAIHARNRRDRRVARKLFSRYRWFGQFVPYFKWLDEAATLQELLLFESYVEMRILNFGFLVFVCGTLLHYMDI